MPRGDRTGPLGMGPMTGRAMGYCAGNAGPGFVFGRGVGFGGGFGRQFGFGRSRGWRQAGFGRFWGYPYPPVTPYSTAPPLNEKQEMDLLDEQEKILEGELNQIKRRQAELKKQKKQE